MERQPGSEPHSPDLSRRELLARAGAVGAAVALSGVLARPASAGSTELLVLTPGEAEILAAYVDRLIPSDAYGPGAVEAGVVTFLDRALAGELAHHLQAYRTGLAAVDRLARARQLGPFVDLPPEGRDALLRMIEAGGGAGFIPDSATFFQRVRDHAIQGMFGDPVYGGNQGFAGWNLLGYPGVKISGVTPGEQALDVVVPPVHRSAYDYPQFRKP